jgi:hypothetical protein
MLAIAQMLGPQTQLRINPGPFNLIPKLMKERRLIHETAVSFQLRKDLRLLLSSSSTRFDSNRSGSVTIASSRRNQCRPHSFDCGSVE